MIYLVRGESGRIVNRFYPNLGIATMSAVLERQEEDVKIFDLNVQDKDYMLQSAKTDNPEVIGFTTSIDDFGNVLGLTKDVKAVSPDSKIVYGGPHASLLREKAFRVADSLDVLVIGDGEETMPNLLSHFRNPTQKVVPGTIQKINSEIATSDDEKVYHNLQNAPFIDWQGYDLSTFFDVLPVETSRGCPYQCPYCAEGELNGNKVRRKDIDDVMALLDYYQTELGVSSFRFADSTFNFSLKRFKDISRAMIKTNPNIKWSSYARFEKLDEEAIELASQAGAVSLYFGIESGDDDVLKKYRKSYDWGHIKKVMENCEEQGIHAHCNFMMGFPGETEENIKNTVNRIRDIRPASYFISPFFVVPTTKIHREAEEYGVDFVDKDWIEKLHVSFYDPTYRYFQHQTMSQDAIFKAAAKASEVLDSEGLLKNLKDYPLLTWISLGGSIKGLRKIWTNPEKHLDTEEVKYFASFREKDLVDVPEKSSFKAKMMEIAKKKSE